MFEWPPNWFLFFGIVAFLAASTAVRGWRDLGIFLAITTVLVFPVKWIGPALGLAELGKDAMSWGVGPSGKRFFNLELSAALLAAFILAALVMIAWKKFGRVPVRNEGP